MTRDEEQACSPCDRLDRATTGQRVRGWFVRSFPSVNTRSLLVEDGGFLYDSDSTNDELPYYVERRQAFLVVPYSKVYNDVKYLIAPQLRDPDDFFGRSSSGSIHRRRGCTRQGGRMMAVGLTRDGADRPRALRRCGTSSSTCSPRTGPLRAPLDIAKHWLAGGRGWVEDGGRPGRGQGRDRDRGVPDRTRDRHRARRRGATLWWRTSRGARRGGRADRDGGRRPRVARHVPRPRRHGAVEELVAGGVEPGRLDSSSTTRRPTSASRSSNDIEEWDRVQP